MTLTTILLPVGSRSTAQEALKLDKPSMSDSDTKRKAVDIAAPVSSGSCNEYVGRKIYDIIEAVDEDEQFEEIPLDVCLDPHDEENNSFYFAFRNKDGSRLTKETVDNKCILVGNDKCGMSRVLAVPIPSGGSLRVHLSTWVNPRLGGYEVCATTCFGVGMVPVGSAQEQQWLRSETETCITDGVQYYGNMNLERLMTGGAGFGAKLSNGVDSFIDYTLDVMQNGSQLHHFDDKSRAKMTLEVFDVKISRDGEGNSELSIVHGSQSFKVTRPADKANKDMQLYFNCLGWADNNTYVEVVSVHVEPPPAPAEDETVVAEATTSAESTDYNKHLKADPILRHQVDALIQVKKLQDAAIDNKKDGEH